MYSSENQLVIEGDPNGDPKLGIGDPKLGIGDNPIGDAFKCGVEENGKGDAFNNGGEDPLNGSFIDQDPNKGDITEDTGGDKDLGEPNLTGLTIDN
jgi:hypothetical protein